MWHKRGAGLVWNDRYEIDHAVDPNVDISRFNFHDFTSLPELNRTVVLYDGPSHLIDAGTSQELLVWDGGFLELDSNGDVLLQWRALDHLSVEQSTDARPESTNSETEWDWL